MPLDAQGKYEPKISYTHDKLIDVMIAQPRAKRQELADIFGYSPEWISRVTNTDAFRMRMAARREEVVDPMLAATLEERFRAVTARSLDVLQEKLDQPAMTIPDNLVLRAAELGAKVFAQQAPSPPPATDHLDRLADRLVALQRPQPQVFVTDVVQGEFVPPAQVQGGVRLQQTGEREESLRQVDPRQMDLFGMASA